MKKFSYSDRRKMARSGRDLEGHFLPFPYLIGSGSAIDSDDDYIFYESNYCDFRGGVAILDNGDLLFYDEG